MIQSLPHTISAALERENAAHASAGSDHALAEIAELYRTPQAFLIDYLESPEGATFRSAVACLSPQSSVLDIGAGRGLSSVYLMLQGHQVTYIEPSLDLCRYAERAATLFGLPLTIYQGTAEALSGLSGRTYDACIFNASLHHCDDPNVALRHCHNLLCPGGRLLLVNEPQLQRFRTKGWFYRQLERNPARMGHYGGNEHTYYRHEYLAMLREAGFEDIQETLAGRYTTPECYLARLRERGASWRGVLVRRLYYRLVNRLLRPASGHGPGAALLKGLSLVQTNFVARKRALVGRRCGGQEKTAGSPGETESRPSAGSDRSSSQVVTGSRGAPRRACESAPPTERRRTAS